MGSSGPSLSFFLQGTLYASDGSILEEGTFGIGASKNEDNSSGDSNFPNFLSIPKMSAGLGLNLMDNKYANLIKMITNYAQKVWPFRRK